MGGSSKSVTVGYKYYVGMHLILCHGMIDKILRIRVDGRDAWLGSRRNGRININKPSLFGGESREGGIVGAIDFENGNSAQTPNDYLVSKLGSLVPAFRGVAGVVLRRVYLGMNPYLKNWDFRIQRIHFRQNGDVQWYDEKAEILVPGKFKQPQAFYFALDISGSMSAITSNGQTRLYNAVQAVKTTLETVDTLRIDSGVRVDIHITAWCTAGSSPATTQYNVSTSSINSLKTWLDALTPGGGTDFREGVVNVAGFYGAVPQDANRVVIFATDGVPGVTGEPGEAEIIASEAAATLFATPGIQSFAFNIDLEDTTYTAQMDNTLGGVPVLDGSDSDAMANAIFFAIMGDSSAMNPAHIIRECLTDQDWGMGYAESDIDDVSFSLAADVLYAESMGISLLWDTQTSIEEFVKEIVRHIDAALFVDRATGKFVLKLIRDDFNEEDLITLDENNIDKISDFKRPAFGELINAVTVTYWDVNTGEDATITISDIALAQQQGNTNLSSIKYPGFVTANIASRVAQRDLKQLSTPLVSCTIYANTDAENLNIGSVFELNWPDYDVSNLTMRVTGIAYGDGKTNRVRIQCAQDVFSLPSQAYVTPSEPEWTDPIQAPIPITNQIAFEVPYLELAQVLGQNEIDTILATYPDNGYVAAAAGRPQESAISARFLTDSGAGFAEVGSLDFCPVATLGEDIDRLASSFAISSISDLEEITLGSWGQIENELVSVVSISSTSITVKRGVLDTVPQAHATGAKIYFWDAYSVADESEYVASDSVDVKLLTVTGMGELSLDAATAETVVMNSRAIRPYPPANVLINTQQFPEALNSPLTVAFNTRNRIQQTGADIVGWYEGSVTPEVGQAYDIILQRNDNAALLDSKIDQTSSPVSLTSSYNGVVDLIVRAKRDSYLNWQDFVHTFQLGVILPTIAPELRGSSVSYTTSSVTSFNAALPAGIVAGDLILLIVHRLSNNYAALQAGYFALGFGTSYNGTTVEHTTYVMAKVAEGTEGSTQTVTAASAGPFMVTAIALKVGTFELPRGMTFSYSYVGSSYTTRRSGGVGSVISQTSATAAHDEFYPPWRGKHSALISVLNRRYSNNDPSGPYSDFSIRVAADSTSVPESFVNGDITDSVEPTLPLLPTAYTKVGGSVDYSNVMNMAIRGSFEPVEPECYPMTIAGTNSTAATSTTIARTAVNIAPVAFELEIAVLQMFGAGSVTITPPSGAGWTLVQKFGQRFAVYKRINTGSEGTSETWNFSSSIVCMISQFAFRAGSFDPSGDVLVQFVQAAATTTYNLPAVTGDSGWSGKNNFVIHSLVREGAAGLANGNPATFPTHAKEFRNWSFTQASAGAQVAYVNCGGMVNAQNSPSGTITSSASFAYESCSIFVKGI